MAKTEEGKTEEGGEKEEEVRLAMSRRLVGVRYLPFRDIVRLTATSR